MRTAEVVYLGNADSLIRASREASAATDASAAQIERSHAKMASSAQKSAETFGKWGTAAAAAVVGGSIDMAIHVEKAATAIAIAGGTSTAAGKRIEDAFRSTSGTAEFSAAKIGEAFSKIAGELKAVEGHALDAKEAMRVMGAAMELTDATGGELNSTTEALGKVMLTFHLNSGKAAEAANILFNASGQTGTSVELLAQNVDKARGQLGALAPSLGATAGLMVELAKQGLQGRQAMGLLNGVFGTLISSSKKVTETLKELNVHVFNNNHEFVGLRSVLEQLHPQLDKYNEKSQVQIAKTLFGTTAWKQMLQVVHEGPAAYEAATKAVEKHGAVTGAAAAQQKSLEGRLKVTKAEMENLSASIGERLLPVFSKMVGALTDGIKWLERHGTAAKILAGVVTTVLGAAVLDFAVTKAVKFVDSLKKMGTGIEILAGKFRLVPSAAATATAETAAAEGTLAAETEGTAGKVEVSNATAGGSFSLITKGAGTAATETATAEATLATETATTAGEIEASNAAAAASFGLIPAAAVAAATAYSAKIVGETAFGGNGAEPFGNPYGTSAEKNRNPSKEAAWTQKLRQEWAESTVVVEGEPAATSNQAINHRGTRPESQTMAITEAAKRYGVDPKVLFGIWGNETNFGKNVNTSSAGAQGDFQFIPETAKAYGYPLTNHPNAQQFAQQANAAAKYMADLIRQDHGNVSAALQQYSDNTPGYAQHAAENASAYGSQEAPEPAAKTRKAASHRAAKHATELSSAQIDKWAEGSIGHFAESWGSNQGPELNQLQKEFHTTAAAWCAEFATTAAMMGGANKAVRTASVATIREWAEQGSHGYKKGVGHTAHVGDMMMFGNSHVGFVQSVNQHAGTVGVIEGNANGSGGVVKRTRGMSEGDYASPLYHNLTTGAVELQHAGKVYQEAAKQAEKLLLSPKQEAAALRTKASVASDQAAILHYKEREAGAEGDFSTRQAMWKAKAKPLSTAGGAANAMDERAGTVAEDKALKGFYTHELAALQKEAKAYARLRDQYLSFARHAHGNAKTFALKKAAEYEGKLDVARKDAAAMGRTIDVTEAKILEGEAAVAALPAEVAAANAEAQANRQSGDLSGYQAANAKIDLEARAGILTEAQAQHAKIENAQRALNGGYGELSAEGRLQVQGDLREFAKAVQSATGALEAHTQALLEATKQLLAREQAARQLAEVENGTIVKAMADMVSGQIAGVNYHGRAITAGAGSAARY